MSGHQYGRTLQPPGGKSLVNSATARQEKNEAIQAALINLGKLLKTVRYYPASHPALKAAAGDALQLFKPLLQNGNLVLTVRKEGFFCDQEQLAPELAILKNLAFFFFARLVHRILVLPELSTSDLSAFARCVILEPEEIQKAGGLQELLLQAHVSSIWLNEVDLAKIQAYRAQLAAEGGGEALDDSSTDGFGDGSDPQETPGPAPAETVPGDNLSLESLLADQLNLDQLIDQLTRERSDQRYRLLAAKLPSRVREQMTEAGLFRVLNAILLMNRLAADQSLSVSRRRDTLSTLQRLSEEDILTYLIDALCSKNLSVKQRSGLNQTLTALKEKAILALMNRLTEEEDAQARRHLGEALIHQGDEALPVLFEALSDRRWYVTRNAIAILGRIRNPQAAVHIRLYLGHKDLRVRREVVRALTRIGGTIAVKSLLQLVETRDKELCFQAFLALGIMKNPEAVPTLVKFLQAPDMLMKRVELKKGAIRALGAIGSPEATPCLEQLLIKRRLWQRGRYNTLRSYAALALGQIGSASSVAILQAAMDDRSKKVVRAASQALRLIQEE
jgi:HEAT repeat protein